APGRTPWPRRSCVRSRPGRRHASPRCGGTPSTTPSRWRRESSRRGSPVPAPRPGGPRDRCSRLVLQFFVPVVPLLGKLTDFVLAGLGQALELHLDTAGAEPGEGCALV